MKIGFLYENGFASNNGSNHLLCAAIEKMLKRGHSVDLIEAVSVQENIDYPRQLEHQNFRCHIVKLKPIAKTNFIGRYLYGLQFARKAARIAKKLNVDLFFVQSAPTVSFLIMRLRKLGKPIVYNIHDVFPGSAFELGIIKSRALNNVLCRIQKIGFNIADRIIVMSDDMRDVLVKEGVYLEKIRVVNIWFDSDGMAIIRNEENSFVRDNSIDLSKLIIQYAGNVGQVFAIDEFAELVNSLRSNCNVEFHIIGQGAKIEELKKRTEGSNIRFFGWQPQERMSEVYSYCDLEIIPLHHGVIGNNVPSKMALAMAVGKPVICIVEESHLKKVFENNQIGYVFSHSEIKKAACLIDLLSKEKNNLKTFSLNTIAYANRYYSKESNTNQLIDILEKLQNKREV